MGGRGSSSSTQRRQSGVLTARQMPPQPNPPQPPQPAPQPVADQTPDANNTPVKPSALDQITKMTDDQLAQLVRQSRSVDMPNHLNDVNDQTQKFVYAAGLNEKPQVLDDASFSAFLKANGMSQRDVIARSIGGGNYTVGNTRYNLTPRQVADMMMTSRLNYVGGKHGGQLYGAGTYFARTGGAATGYGGQNALTAQAVLNPKTTKAISLSSLQRQVSAFQRSHPKFAAAVGSFRTGGNGNASIYALAMGYNVITDGNNGQGGYVNVIDRSALVYRKIP